MAAEPAAARTVFDVARHTLVYGAGFVTTAAVGLLLLPVYAHQLSPAEFGLLALMLVLYGLMKQVYDLGLQQSVARFFFDQDRAEADVSGLRQMECSALTFVIGYGAILTTALCLPAEAWSRLITSETDHADLVRIVAVMLFAEALTVVPLTVMRMQERSTQFVAISLARALTGLVLGIVFVAILDWGVRGALLAGALPVVLMVVLLLPLLANSLRARPSAHVLAQMLRFGLPLFPALVSIWVIDAADRYLLELLADRDDVGSYALAYRVSQMMAIVVAAFSLAWPPLGYRIYESSDARQEYRRLATVYVVGASVLAVGLALCARPIVELVAPPSYARAADVLPLIILAHVLYGLHLVVIIGMGLMKRTAPLMWISLFAAVTNVGLNVLLIPYWGITAAALTTVLAFAILVWGGWYWSHRVYPVAYDWVRMWGTLAVSSLVVGAALLVDPGEPAAQLAWAALMWLLFLALLSATSIVGAEDRDALRGLLRRLRGRASKRPAGEAAS